MASKHFLQVMNLYKQVPSIDDASETSNYYEEKDPCKRRRCLSSNTLLIVLLLLLTNALSFSLGRIWPWTNLEHLRAITTWSPLQGSLPYQLHTDKLNATSWTDYPSLWRADPSHEGDELWKQSWETHPMLMPISDIPNLDQDPSYVARWLDDPNMAMVGNNAHHLLHCIDVLRKAVWSDHYWPHGNLNPGHRTHQTHCVDLLRQDLMCRAPMDVYPLIWMEEESQPTPNFNVSLKCADWGGMSTWWRERQMTDEQVGRAFVKPEDVKQWPAPDALRKENLALQEICSRPNVTCTVAGEPLDIS